MPPGRKKERNSEVFAEEEGGRERDIEEKISIFIKNFTEKKVVLNGSFWKKKGASPSKSREGGVRQKVKPPSRGEKGISLNLCMEGRLNLTVMGGKSPTGKE